MRTFETADAWCSMALHVARLSFGQHQHDNHLGPCITDAMFPRLRKICLETHSPWKAYADIGLKPDPAPDLWPYLWDISTGVPAQTSPALPDFWALRPIIGLECYCGPCGRFQRVLVDCSRNTLQHNFNFLLCPGCKRQLWPWRSPARIAEDSISNLLSFPYPVSETE